MLPPWQPTVNDEAVGEALGAIVERGFVVVRWPVPPCGLFLGSRPDRPGVAEPAVAVTAGLTGWRWPEFLIVGLTAEEGSRCLEALVGDLAADRDPLLTEGPTPPGLFGTKGPGWLCEIPPGIVAAWAPVAAKIYGHTTVRCVQVVVPDGSGRLPWDAHHDTAAWPHQTLVGVDPCGPV